MEGEKVAFGFSAFMERMPGRAGVWMIPLRAVLPPEAMPQFSARVLGVHVTREGDAIAMLQGPGGGVYYYIAARKSAIVELLCAARGQGHYLCPARDGGSEVYKYLKLQKGR